MIVNHDERDLSKLIVVGDRILIKLKTPQSKIKTALFLPPGVQEEKRYER